MYDIEVMGDIYITCKVQAIGNQCQGCRCKYGLYDGGIANGPIVIGWSSRTGIQANLV